MRQPATIILLIFAISVGFYQPSFSAIKGRVQYTIPTYYSNLSETELQKRACEYYYLAQKLEDGQINEDMTKALTLYTVLQNMNPENIDYSIKLGILYDKIGKDRYAKGNFSRAIGINPDSPMPYFYLGEFYYKRALYRNADAKEIEERAKILKQKRDSLSFKKGKAPDE